MLKVLSSLRLCVTALCFLLLGTVTLAQQKTVTGKITGDDGNALPGVTVSARGTKFTTQTNADGNFSLSVPNGTTRLVVTSVGFEQQEVDISAQNSVSVSLKTATNGLSEVVVTGYSAQRRKDITGSVAVVNVNNLKQIPSGTTEALLQGQAAGVTVITSGVPGGGSNVRIRGVTSIGNTDPLVIIDGTPGSLHDLNVNDIESMQVLKDAGAASIYGVRGSNGVVVVTTKRGKTGKARISYDAFYGTQRPLKDNAFNIANTAETGQAYFRQYQNDGAAFNHKQFGTGGGPTIPDYITPVRGKEGDPLTNPSTYALYSNQITRANKTGTDWFGEVFNPARIQSHSVSASGGSDKSTYFFSLGYFDQPGTLLSTYLKRYSARINTQFNIKDKIRVGENAYIFYKQNPGFTNQNEGNIISYTYRESPIIPVYDIRGNFAGTGSQGLGNSQNPVANALRQKNNRANDWQVNGNVYAEVDFLRHFTARTSLGGTIDNFYYYNFSYTAYENAENNANPNGFTEGSGYNAGRTWTNTLTYTNTFGKHNVRVLAGTEAITNYGRAMVASRGNYYITDVGNLTVNPSLFVLNFGSGTQTNSGTPYQSALYSQFARADYSYNDKYLVSATVRRDGSSVFDPAKRYGIFPAFTGGWRISHESFFPQTSWINELKLRGGWGKLGSISNINSSNAFTQYGQSSASSYYDINGSNNTSVFGLRASQVGNIYTTWEEDVVTNIGLDATLFKNKVDFSIEWYNKAISGLLFQPPVAAAFGDPTTAFVNSGNISNKGIDASLTYHGAIKRDLHFDVTGTFTSYKNLVKSLPNGVKYQDRSSAGSTRIGAFTRLQPGQAVGAFFGYQMIGLFQDASDVSKSPTQQDAAPGLIKFRDVNGDGKITSDDRTFFGNPNPDFTAGLNLAVTYKNFDLSTFFYASVGNDVINYVRYWTDFPQVFDGAVSKDAVYNSWTPQNTNAKVPKLTRSANFSNTTQFNSYYMENGSFLKCKSLVVGFTVPSKKLSRFGIDRFRIYGQATNLFQLTKYTGLDPELTGSDLNNNTNFGIDFGNFPSNQKVFTVGVNLSF